jgi:hypothetical protein
MLIIIVKKKSDIGLIEAGFLHDSEELGLVDFAVVV